MSIGVWITRFVKIILLFFILLLLLVLALLNFGPVSSPTVGLRDLFGLHIEAPASSVLEQRLQLPEGFTLGQYATGLKKVRILEFTSRGDLLASQPAESQVLLLQADQNQDGHHDGIQVLLDQLNRPHGLVLDKGFLYVGEADAIGRVAFDADRGQLAGNYERIITGLPDSLGHWPKSILIQGEYLFVNVGSSCNVCEEEDERHATIMRFKLDGSDGQIYARGLRNSVGMDIAPWSGELYATDNGRDMLGDDYPVCELNRIVKDGFYGWPYINDYGDLDPDLGAGRESLLNIAIAPVFGFRAHNAPLGIEFLDQTTMPQGYERSALVALHGSWNRREPDGYKVVSLHWQEDGGIVSRDFLSGFEEAGNVIGRPVDIEEGPDDCLYISEDYAGSIYRVCYGLEQTAIVDTQSMTTADTHWQSLTETDKAQSHSNGSVLYQRHGCSHCHQLNGQGAGNGKPIEALSERYTSANLAAYFLTPNPPMPQYHLTEQQRLDLAVFLLMETQSSKP